MLKRLALNRLLFGIMLGAIATPALGAETDDGFCRNGGFPAENSNFGLAIITGKGRVYFLEDMGGCPNSDRRCRRGYYVVPGDRVITGRTNGQYVCAYFPNKGGGTAGWVDKLRLRPLAVRSNPAQSFWLGRWSQEGNPTLRITRRHGAIHIVGDAYWPGPVREKDWPPGWPHSGGIDGTLSVFGDRAHYDVDGCKVDFVLVGDMLIASDNEMCGGMNVRFDGVYRRGRA